MKSTQNYANEFYKIFSECDGNQHIASLYALQKAIDIMQRNKPKSVLEVGLGIGSISYAILEYCKRKNIEVKYSGTEANKFCLQHLPINLGSHFQQIKLYESINEIDDDEKFDLIIIDGADDSLEKLKNKINSNCCIFIEGDRSFQVEKIRKWFPRYCYVHTISNYRNPKYGPFSSADWSGGAKIIYVNPTFIQKLHYASERVRSAILERKRMIYAYISEYSSPSNT